MPLMNSVAVPIGHRHTKKMGQPVSSPFENAERIRYVVTVGQSRLKMEELAEGVHFH